MEIKQRKRTIPGVKKQTTRVTVDFPTAQHRKLKAIAALEGVSLQDYIRSRVITDSQGEDILDNELKPIVNRVIKKTKGL